MEDNKWTENIIIADADHLDRVAFDLTVNFERMLGRRVPPADLACWAECAALDGGLREGHHQTTLVLIHNHEALRLQNFVPSDYASELNNQAFQGRLGEFVISAVSPEALVDKDEMLLDVLQTVAAQPDVRRLVVVPADHLADRMRSVLHRIEREELRVTVLTMQPVQGGGFQQEQLGYSLMAALGIHSSEIQPS